MTFKVNTLAKKKILVFDSECRPLHYSEWRREDQITGLAYSWLGDETIHVETLKQDLSNEEEMLDEFFNFFNYADIVVGHYIRKHDLPLLSDHAFRFGIHMGFCGSRSPGMSKAFLLFAIR